MASALALVVATASARLAKADVSVSTVTPRFSHSTANITHLPADYTVLGWCVNLLRGCLVPLAGLPRGLLLGVGEVANGALHNSGLGFVVGAGGARKAERRSQAFVFSCGIEAAPQ
jgi:hypothetical protein